MKYEAVVEPIGNGAGVEVPPAAIATFDAGQRPKVVITINGHTWRSGVVLWDARSFVGIGAKNRKAADIAPGDAIDVDLQLDTEPRVVEVPDDLTTALDNDQKARAAFERLSYGKQRGLVVKIERAKAADTRQRRVREAIASLHQ